MIPSFRILGDFPSFRLLGFGGIFRRSVIPRFRLLGFGSNFRRSVILRFRLLGFGVIFRRSVIPPFCHSAVPSFRLLGSPVKFTRGGRPSVLDRAAKKVIGQSSVSTTHRAKKWGKKMANSGNIIVFKTGQLSDMGDPLTFMNYTLKLS